MNVPLGRCVFLAGLLAAAAPAAAAEPEADPPALTQARGAYEAQARAATEQIRQRYLAQLEAMKQQFTGRNNAESVLAVQNEINRIRQEGGMASAFDWQRLRASTSYSYRDALPFAKSGAYADPDCSKLLDRHVGASYSARSVGWQQTRPSPIVFKFTRPLLPASIRLYLLGSEVQGGVEIPESVRVYNDAKLPRGELIGERTRIPDRSGWVEIPFALKAPLERIRVEIDPAKTGWTILEEVELR